MQLPACRSSLDTSVYSARDNPFHSFIKSKGLIQRRTSAEDRRCVQVYVTLEGASAAKAMRTMVFDATVYVLTELGEHDAQEYVRIVKRIADLPHPKP